MTQSSKYDFLFEGYDPLSDEGYDLSAAAERLQNALGVEVEVVQAPSQGGLSENYYLAVNRMVRLLMSQWILRAHLWIYGIIFLIHQWLICSELLVCLKKIPIIVTEKKQDRI